MISLFRNLVVSATALGLLLGMATTSSAQVPGPLPGRVFTVAPIGSPINVRFNTTASGQTFDIAAKTYVNVLPYLFAAGNLSVEFTVDGWGQGIGESTSSVTIWHNMELLIGFRNFANPSDPLNPAHTIEMKVGASIVRPVPGSPLPTGGLPLFNLTDVGNVGTQANANFNNQLLTVFPINTGGKFDLDLFRQIIIQPQDGPARGWTINNQTAYKNDNAVVTLTTVW